MSFKKSTPKLLKRRDFVKNSLAASSLFIVPRHVLGGVGYTAPSDQLALAGIGVGGKGESDLRNATVNGRERVIALCDVDTSPTSSARKSIKRYSKATFYENFKAMLDKEKAID